MDNNLLWKPDWPACQQALVRWWQGQGLAVALDQVRPVRWEGPAYVKPPSDLEIFWTDPVYRCSAAEWALAGVDCRAEAFPYFDTQIGPGSLGTFLGAALHFDVETVWYAPCISDPEACDPIRFDPDNRWLKVHLALVDEGLRRARGRYLVGVPDLIENLDTLAALRGDHALLLDLVDRPGWVLDRLEEINRAYFQAFDLFYDRVKDASGGNAFSAFRIWGPGRTAKLQCDISAALSPRMFRRFAQPFLRDQCQWLDYSVYHLDGTNATQHLDLLLEIDALDAIEWTPQAGRPGGGDPAWYDLYRRIRAGGKSVEAIGVRPEEVIPLVDAVGPQGLLILIDGPVDQPAAEHLLRRLEPYRG